VGETWIAGVRSLDGERVRPVAPKSTGTVRRPVSELLPLLLSPGRFMPHGHCYLWDPGLVWLHVLSDALIALAYTSIPFTLLYLVRKRKDVPFNGMLLCFGTFIIACGTTHAMEVVTLWTPVYWLSGSIKSVTAVASVLTAVLLVRVVPRALRIPTAQQLSEAHEHLRSVHEALESRVEERTAELTRNNAELAREVAERKRAEEARTSAEERYRALLENARDAIAVLTTDGIILEANRSCERVMGVPRAEMLGHHLAEFVPEDGRTAQREEFEAAVSKGGDSLPPAPHSRPDGSVVHVELSRTVVEVSGARYVLSIGRDVTDRLRLEDQLREARRRSESESREYQTRLQRMAFDAAVAEERERRRIAIGLHDRIGQALALTQIKLTSLRREVDDRMVGAGIEEAMTLLAQSIVDSRSLVFELTPPVLYDLGLKDALYWLAEDLERRHGMRIEIADDDADKRLDETTAAIVFRSVRELLVNVLKHAKVMAARVSLRRVGDHLDVVVEDAGVGFDLGAAAAAAHDGGFGLFSLREQISRLGGTVEVKSAKDQGTRIRLVVPIERAEAARPAPGAGRT
jgi:PAS domain S-box-containing protein